LRKENPQEIVVKIVTKSSPTGLKFDVVTSDGHVKSYDLDDYELRQYRVSERDLIQYLVEQFYEEIMPYGSSYRLRLIFF